ncbi:hypothetical protein Vafri_12385 [Volvox africanus]|uniref:tRNA/rRNA methyltransferase SpoU type domain-containing protein n=1 Tax=Volvox africanus TaxID=51714 RepID=A0A8J4BA06_9CHLO|nr:hypothetical protein Vafri_12385 [Volvox africanus]
MNWLRNSAAVAPMRRSIAVTSTLPSNIQIRFTEPHQTTIENDSITRYPLLMSIYRSFQIQQKSHCINWIAMPLIKSCARGSLALVRQRLGAPSRLSIPPACQRIEQTSPAANLAQLVVGPGQAGLHNVAIAPTRTSHAPSHHRVATCGETAVTTLSSDAAVTLHSTTTPVLSVRQSWHRPDVAVVLVHPQIPQNTGNVARTCAATAAPLHLVGPLGFELDNRKLKRAGLDYWDSVTMSTHNSWGEFFAFFCDLPQPKRLVAFTVYGKSYYAGPEFTYQPGDWLVFGAETSGLPPQAHGDVAASGGCLVKIPIRDIHVRSINLSVAVGVGLFEAIRQLDTISGSGHIVNARRSPTLGEIAAAHRDGKPLGLKAGSVL